MNREVWYATFDQQTLDLAAPAYNYFLGAEQYFRPQVIPLGVDPSTANFGIPANTNVLIEGIRYNVIGLAGARQVFADDHGIVGPEYHFGFEVTEAVNAAEQFGFARQVEFEEWKDVSFFSHIKAAPAGPRRIRSNNATAVSGKFALDVFNVQPAYDGALIRLQVELLVSFAGQAVVIP